MTKEDIMRDLVHYGARRSNARNAEENINKHYFICEMHKKHYLSENEFAIYSKARKNMLLVPLIALILALIIGAGFAFYLLSPEEGMKIENAIMLGLTVAICAWVVLFLLGSSIAVFTKSNRYLSLYDKWYKQEWSRLEDLHAIFTPDGWKAYKTSRAIATSVGILLFLAVIFMLTVCTL